MRVYTEHLGVLVPGCIANAGESIVGVESDNAFFTNTLIIADNINPNCEACRGCTNNNFMTIILPWSQKKTQHPSISQNAFAQSHAHIVSSCNLVMDVESIAVLKEVMIAAFKNVWIL